MRISGIEKRKRQARYDVYADGVYLATLSDEAILTHRLKVGMELPEGELVAIVEEAAKQDAVNCILTLLSGKAYTCKMARDKLREKGFGKDAVDYAVEKMLDYGYLDDLAYAEEYWEQTKTSRSKRRVRQELWQKGIADSIVQSVLKDDCEVEACMSNLRKKVRGRVLDEAMRLRVMRSLVSQGFDYDTVKRAMAKYEEETSND